MREGKKGKELEFCTKKGEILTINGKPTFSRWEFIKPLINSTEFVYKLDHNKFVKWLPINSQFLLYQNKKKDLIIFTVEKGYLFLEYLNPILEYKIPITSKIISQAGTFVDIGEPLTEGTIDLHELLYILFKYHSIFDGVMKGTFRSLNKFQLILVHSIQAIYQSQGVNISSKHIEIIVRQMTSKVVIKESGDTPFLTGELIRLSLIQEIYIGLNNAKTRIEYKTPKFQPLLLSATNSALSKDGFLSSAGFQETKRVLSKAAIEGSSDWLRGLKECVIIGRLIPAGSAFFNYKNYLDNIYLFKNQENKKDDRYSNKKRNR